MRRTLRGGGCRFSIRPNTISLPFLFPPLLLHIISYHFISISLMSSLRLCVRIIYFYPMAPSLLSIRIGLFWCLRIRRHWSLFSVSSLDLESPARIHA
ncbi:hypothetical protein BDZ97DRAFT_275375 [Flammula alnicola]|nr:hypothetical protein BDZ97DRAFT_275375 [Flammula alnicola]